MPWNSPPEAVRASVNRIIGGDVFAMAAQRYLRVLAELGGRTEVGERSWFRTMEEQQRLRAAGDPAARYSQHQLGLAIDLQIRDAQLRQRATELLRAQEFTVIPHSRGRLHVQVLSPSEFRSLLPQFLGAGLFGGGR